MSTDSLLNPGAAVSLTVPPETTFAARDGSTVRVRAVRPDDEIRLVAFFHSLSESSRSLRFAGALGDWALEQVAHRQAIGDGEKGAGLVALGDQDRILGHAEYVLMIASASAAQYEQVIHVLGADPEVDALVVIFIPPLVTRPEDVARALVNAGRELAGRKPLLSVFMQARGIPDELRATELRIPSYDFPENAAIALARAANYAQWRARPVEARPVLSDIQGDRAAAIVATALGSGAG